MVEGALEIKIKIKSQSKAKQSKAKQSKAKQSKAKQSKAKQKQKQSKAKQSKAKAKQSKAKQSKAKQSKAKQSKAKQSKAKQSKAKQSKSSVISIRQMEIQVWEGLAPDGSGSATHKLTDTQPSGASPLPHFEQRQVEKLRSALRPPRFCF
ncbi:hypothetical protein [Pseudomonas poae]|uniref:hypothetical protein n=1 Tax=Pseudomonas poae TaxID=200451 RepID=UPI0030CF5012